MALLALFLAPALALAQTARPTESVTVTGTKSREVIESFVQSFAAPTRMAGKLARWEDGICPIAVGLRPAAIKFITARVKDIAAQAGAPVNGSASCSPNVAIIFTKSPQGLLDNIRQKQPWFLGYSDNSDQLEKRAAVTRPIQAWYMTATKDVNGNSDIDTSKRSGIGIPVPCGICPGGFVYLPNATAAKVTGSRLGDGLHSTFYDVVIVADPDKLVEYEMGLLSDYIAMLALAQLNSLDTCQQLPSIVNMLAAGCERKANELTANDLGYLRGLYKMGAGRNLRAQKDDIAYQMEQNLKGN